MMFKICAATDVGCMRQNNEDGFYINNMCCYNTSECMVYEKATAPVLVFVADGVGGSKAGEEATRICIDTAYLNPTPNDDSELVTLIDKMNRDACKLRENIDTACTLAGILFGEDSLYWFNIGDSRVYMLKQGFLNQLSTDDTVSGLSGDMESKKEPLIQYMGKQNVIPHIKEITELSKFLICTDGLTDMLSLDEIEDICKEKVDLKETIEELIKQAKARGGQDNITVILAEPIREET